MVRMKQGFYRAGGRIHYGEYPESQVSGWMQLSAAPPEMLATDRTFAKGERADLLFPNHKLTQPELEALKRGLGRICRCLGAEELGEIDFSQTECRLGLTLPQEIKLLSRALAQVPAAMEGKERFLPLEELALDQGNLVFYKIRRTPVGLSLDRGALMRYYKKEWRYDPEGESFLCCALDRLAVWAVEAMPFCRAGRIKGELRTTLRPERLLEKIYRESFPRLEEYQNGGNIILCRPGAFGWFRQNGFYADIRIGADSEALLEQLQPPELNAVWEK